MKVNVNGLSKPTGIPSNVSEIIPSEQPTTGQTPNRESTTANPAWYNTTQEGYFYGENYELMG